MAARKRSSRRKGPRTRQRSAAKRPGRLNLLLASRPISRRLLFGRRGKGKASKDLASPEGTPGRIPQPPAPLRQAGEGALETDADRLYDLVASKSSVAVEEAGKALGVATEKIEEWAGILEDHRLIRLHYPKIGKPLLLAAEPKPSPLLPKPPKKPSKGPVLLLLPVLAIVLGFAALRNPDLLQSGVAGFLMQAAIGIVVLLGALFAVRKARRRRIRAKPAPRKKGR